MVSVFSCFAIVCTLSFLITLFIWMLISSRVAQWWRETSFWFANYMPTCISLVDMVGLCNTHSQMVLNVQWLYLICSEHGISRTLCIYIILSISDTINRKSTAVLLFLAWAEWTQSTFVPPRDEIVTYVSAISRYIDLKFIQDTYRVKGQGHRNGTLLFEGTVISQKQRHRHFSIFLVDTSLYALPNETIKTRAGREMTSQNIRQYLTFNM